MPSRILTIMITDIKGFTERTSSTSREDMRNLLDEHENLLLPLVAKFRGTLIKTIGDSLLVTFESPTNAILCGIMMQEKLREFNEEKAEGEKIQVRIALDAGEVEMREGDVFGESVNIAARIEGIMDASEIYFTESVYLAMNKAEVPSSEVGQRRLKGIPEPIKIYRVIQDEFSDKYQQLLKRLKTRRFSDIKVSSTGSRMKPVAARRFPRLLLIIVPIVVLAAAAVLGIPRLKGYRVNKQKDDVLAALDDGDFGLALARADSMLKGYPEEKASHEAVLTVVEAEVNLLVDKGSYDGALALIDTRQNERPYLKLNAIHKKVALAYAAGFAADGNYARSSALYNMLMEKYPKDMDVLMEVVARLGTDFGSGCSTGLGIYAATLVADNTEGPLDDVVGRTLIDAMKSDGPYGDSVRNRRNILAERYPPSIDAMQKLIGTDDYEARMNSYFLLKETGVLKPHEELRHHVVNVTSLSSSYRKAGEESIACLKEAMQAENWDELKKAAGIGLIEDVAALHSWSDYQKHVSDVFVKGFLPEIEATLFKWLAGEDMYLRANAFYMLHAAGLSDKVDDWAFHAKTLVNFEVVYRPEHFLAALQFFGEQAGTERVEDAKKAFEAGKTYIQRRIDSYLKSGLNHHANSAQRSLAKLQEALAAFNTRK